MTTRCANCGSRFANCDRDEDGYPYIEATRCQHPGCETWLCRAGCTELSFTCACGQRFCESHGLTFDGERLCFACAAEAETAAVVALNREYPDLAREIWDTLTAMNAAVAAELRAGRKAVGAETGGSGAKGAA